MESFIIISVCIENDICSLKIKKSWGNALSSIILQDKINVGDEICFENIDTHNVYTLDYRDRIMMGIHLQSITVSIHKSSVIKPFIMITALPDTFINGEKFTSEFKFADLDFNIDQLLLT